jgi:hypothetical protein
MRYLALAIVALILAVPSAFGQDVPDYIPDRPDWSPGDVNRERLVEKHRSEVSRFYGASHFAVMPSFGALTSSFTTVDQIFQGGIRLRSGNSVHVLLAARSTYDGLPGLSGSPDGIEMSSLILGGGVDIRGNVLFEDSPFTRRTSVGLGSSLMFGSDAAVVQFELNPRYTVFRTQKWALPVGFRLTHVVLPMASDTPVRKTFFGLSTGIEVNFGTRDQLR